MDIPGTIETEEANVPIAPNTTRARTGRPVLIRWSYALSNWLGLVPFLLFCLLFEILPAIVVIQGSFTDNFTGAYTLANFQNLFSHKNNFNAFQTSISISLVSALIGTVVGFLAAYGVYSLRSSSLRNFLVGFSSITANFAGVPLAFAFVATLGVNGFLTLGLLHWFHLDIYNLHFNLYTFGGLVLAYTYFELPLMILITLPALNALRPEWKEAATNLGASGFIYWRRVALPILLPSLIAAAMLLFANAFGAYATAYALAQGGINIVPILIGYAVAGNVSVDTGLGNALAVGMIVVLFVTISLYVTLVRRASVWTGR